MKACSIKKSIRTASIKKRAFWAYAAVVILLQAEPFLLRKFFRKACLCVRKVPEHTCFRNKPWPQEVIHWTASVGIRPSVIFLLFATWLQWIIRLLLHMNQLATAEMTWQHLEWRTWRSLVNSILFILTVRLQNLKPIYFLQPAKALICQIVSNRKTKARCCTHRAFFAL